MALQDEQLGGPATVLMGKGVVFVPTIDAMEPDFLEEEMD